MTKAKIKYLNKENAKNFFIKSFIPFLIGLLLSDSYIFLIHWASPFPFVTDIGIKMTNVEDYYYYPTEKKFSFLIGNHFFDKRKLSFQLFAQSGQDGIEFNCFDKTHNEEIDCSSNIDVDGKSFAEIIVEVNVTNSESYENKFCVSVTDIEKIDQSDLCKSVKISRK